MVSTVKANFLESFTTAERNALVLSSSSPYLFGLNTDTGKVEFTNDQGGTWYIVSDSDNAANVQFVYISNSGSDTIGTGTLDNPYETLSYALSQITDNTPAKPYAIQFIRGVYSETNLSLKPWIDLVGNNSELTVTNPVDLDVTYESVGGNVKISSFSKIDFIGGTNLDFNFASTPLSIISIQDILNYNSAIYQIIGSSFQPTIIFIDNVNSPSARVNLDITNCTTLINNFFGGDFTYQKNDAVPSYRLIMSNCDFSQDILISSSVGSIISDTKAVKGNGAITLESSASGTLQHASTADYFINAITIDGAATTVNIDQINQIPLLLNSPTVIYRNISDGLTANYNPSNYTPPSTVVSGHLEGIDNRFGDFGLQDAFDNGNTITLPSLAEFIVENSVNNPIFKIIENGSSSSISLFGDLDAGTNDITNVNSIVLNNNGSLSVAGSSTTFNIVNNSQGGGSNIGIFPGENVFFKPINLQNNIDIIFPFDNANDIGTSINRLANLWTYNARAHDVVIEDSGSISLAAGGLLYTIDNDSSGTGANIGVFPFETLFFKDINLQSGIDIVFPATGTNSIGSSTNVLGDLWVSLINGIQPSGGIFMQTSNGPILAASTTETSILGSGEGSLVFPANTLQISGYKIDISGILSAGVGNTLTIRLKSNGTTVLGSVVVTLENTTTKSFEIEIDFVVRQIGAATTAVMVSSFDFTFNRNAGNEFVGQRAIVTNNTTFDTTISNTLSLTAQFSTADVANSIQTSIATMTRTY